MRPLQAGALSIATTTNGTDNKLIQLSMFGIQISWFKVIHVWCNRSSIYTNSSFDGWQPDALLSLDEYFPTFNSSGMHVEAGVTHAFWAKVTVAEDAVVGSYTPVIHIRFVPEGSASEVDVIVPMKLEVWPMPALPPLSSATFRTVFNFFYRTDDDGATDVGKYYGNGNLTIDMKRKYFDLLCDARTPADSP